MVGDRALINIKGRRSLADINYTTSQNLTVGGLGAAGTLNGSVSNTRFGHL
jgi:hypothetical protein